MTFTIIHGDSSPDEKKGHFIASTVHVIFYILLISRFWFTDFDSQVSLSRWIKNIQNVTSRLIFIYLFHISYNPQEDVVADITLSSTCNFYNDLKEHLKDEMNAEKRPSLTWQLLKTLSGKNLPQLGKNKEQE